MFVNGPVGTTVTADGCASSVFAIQSIAWACSGGRDGRRQVGAVEPGLAVDLRGDATFPDERPVGAGRDGDRIATDVIEDADGVCRCLLERLIAGDGGDTEQIQLGAGEREEQRDRVVVAGVAVEDDVGHGLRVVRERILSPRSSLTGRAPACGPSPDLGTFEPVAVARAHTVAPASLDEVPGVGAALADRGPDGGADLTPDTVEIVHRQLRRASQRGDPRLPQDLIGEQVADPRDRALVKEASLDGRVS